MQHEGVVVDHELDVKIRDCLVFFITSGDAINEIARNETHTQRHTQRHTHTHTHTHTHLSNLQDE